MVFTTFIIWVLNLYVVLYWFSLKIKTIGSVLVGSVEKNWVSLVPFKSNKVPYYFLP